MKAIGEKISKVFPKGKAPKFPLKFPIQFAVEKGEDGEVLSEDKKSIIPIEETQNETSSN